MINTLGIQSPYLQVKPDGPASSMNLSAEKTLVNFRNSVYICINLSDINHRRQFPPARLAAAQAEQYLYDAIFQNVPRADS